MAIHLALMQPQSGSGSGIIDQCSHSAIDSYRTLSNQPGSNHLKFLDDTTYYDEITNLVEYYQSIEIEGLSLIQEAGYFDATQDLIKSGTVIAADEGAATCVLAEGEDTNTDAAVTCDSMKQYTQTVHDDLVAEWALAGRPYTDEATVLEIPSTASNQPGNYPAILWAHDPAAVTSMNKGTWSSTNATTTYDGLSGWQPATLADWQSLSTLAKTAYGTCIIDKFPHYGNNFFCYLEQAKDQFVLHNGSFYWIPGQSSDSVKLPTTSADGQQMTVLGNGGRTYPYSYTKPTLTLRCFVEVLPSNDGSSPLACGQDWIDNHVVGTETANDPGTISDPFYKIDWTFKSGSFPGNVNTKFGYAYFSPYYDTDGDYAYNSDAGTYPALINTAVGGDYPAFLNPITFSVVTKWESCYAATHSCPAATDSKTVSPPDAELGLWPVLHVPTTAQCVTTTGVPKLCTANTTAAPHQSDRFDAWVADNIPDPNIQVPVPKAQPGVAVNGNTATCNSAGWDAPPTANWQWGGVTDLATTWTGSDGPGGTISKTVTTDNPSLDLAKFAKDANFPANSSYQLTCVLSARWKLLANAGTVSSPTVDITQTSGSPVATRLQDAPANVSATAGDSSATVHWTVPDSHGATIVSFTISPYIDGIAEKSLTPTPVNGSNVKDKAGSVDTVEVSKLDNGKGYRFTVTANVYAVGTGHLVQGHPSALTATVTPGLPLTPLTPGATTTTTTTVPLTPLKPGTTTTVPLSPLSTTTTTKPTGPFQQSITATGNSRALVKFTPSSAMSFVDLHYLVTGSSDQQDFRMDQSGGSWTHEVDQLQPGAKLAYWFSYQTTQSGAPVKTSDRFSYTQSGT